MNTQKTVTPIDYMAQLIAGRISAMDTKWGAGRLKDIKILSMTDKGNIAEDFTAWLGRHHGFKVKESDNRKGPYDVKIAGKTLEVKMATMDIHGKFQFNGIRYDTKYDLLIVIGITPDDVLFNIYPRRELIDMPMVNMAKGTNATFKLTRNVEQLLHLNRFPEFFN